MLGKDRMASIVSYVFSRSKADQTEVIVNYYESYLTRFANSQIHQNVAEHNTTVAVRAVVGKKIGVATTNLLAARPLAETVNAALEIARHQADNPDFQSLAKTKRREYAKLKTYFPKTHSFSAEDRAAVVKLICDQAKVDDLRAFGSFTNGVSEFAVANSLGTFAYNVGTDAYCNVAMLGESSGSGYAEGADRNVEKVDARAIAARAITKAVKSREPGDTEPGVYEVVLEPLAVADFLGFLGWLGLGAKTYQEGRSFLCDKMGQKITGDNINLSDDFSLGFAFPFDFEGAAKQKVVFIEKGVAKGLAYDSMTAFKEGKKSTGHALPAPNAYGPMPWNLILDPGTTSLAEMIGSTKKGILITRFHYTNVVDPKKTIITGMTRDGTFLVENGEVTRPLKNLRFTESILDSLSHVSGLSKELTLVGGGAGYGGRFATGSLVPALKTTKFTFTSKTEF
jgi:predicted Zn-dependent protease